MNRLPPHFSLIRDRWRRGWGLIEFILANAVAR